MLLSLLGIFDQGSCSAIAGFQGALRLDMKHGQNKEFKGLITVSTQERKKFEH